MQNQITWVNIFNFACIYHAAKNRRKYNKIMFFVHTKKEKISISLTYSDFIFTHYFQNSSDLLVNTYFIKL